MTSQVGTPGCPTKESVKRRSPLCWLSLDPLKIRAPQKRATDDESETETRQLPKHRKADAQNIDLIINAFESKPGYEVPQLLASRIGPVPMSVTSQKETDRAAIPFSAAVAQHRTAMSDMLTGRNPVQGRTTQFHVGDLLPPPRRMTRSYHVPPEVYNFLPQTINDEWVGQVSPSGRTNVSTTVTDKQLARLQMDARVAVLAQSGEDVSAVATLDILNKILGLPSLSGTVKELLGVAVTMEAARAQTLRHAMSNVAMLETNILLLRRKAYLQGSYFSDRLKNKLYHSEISTTRYLFEQSVVDRVIAEHQTEQQVKRDQSLTQAVTKMKGPSQQQKKSAGGGGGGGGQAGRGHGRPQRGGNQTRGPGRGRGRGAQGPSSGRGGRGRGARSQD